MINTFLTRVPFFPAKGTFDSIDDLLSLQINRAVCRGCVNPGLNPKNYLPEFICATELTIAPALDYVRVYKSDFSVFYTLTSGQLALITPHDVVVNGVSQTVYMFSGEYGANLFNCGEQYFYVIKRGDNYWYSDMWEAGDFTGNVGRDTIVINYKATGCNIGQIFYSLKEGFTNRLFFKSELLYGENEVIQTNQENDQGDIVSSFTKIVKRYKAVIPQTFDPLYDALTSLSMYVGQENCTVEIKVPDMADEYADVVDFSLENPDYKTDECSPIVKFNVAIQPKTTDTGCCNEENIMCFAGFTPLLPELDTSEGVAAIKLKLAAGFNPVTECFIQVAYKLTSNTTYLTANFLRSELVDFNSIEVAPGDYHVKIRILASTSACYSNYSLEQTVTVSS